MRGYRTRFYSLSFFSENLDPLDPHIHKVPTCKIPGEPGCKKGYVHVMPCPKVSQVILSQKGGALGKILDTFLLDRMDRRAHNAKSMEALAAIFKPLILVHAELGVSASSTSDPFNDNKVMNLLT